MKPNRFLLLGILSALLAAAPSAVAQTRGAQSNGVPVLTILDDFLQDSLWGVKNSKITTQVVNLPAPSGIGAQIKSVIGKIKKNPPKPVRPIRPIRPIKTPEPGVVSLLAIDLAAVGGLILLIRRRRGREVQVAKH